MSASQVRLLLLRDIRVPVATIAATMVVGVAWGPCGAPAADPRSAPAPSVEVVEGAIVLRRDAGEVLRYHTAEVPPPEGADPLFRRSGFIHPLRSPSGGVVTGIHPDDHIHHLGLWHAWTHTRHDGREIDFWNLAKGLGTVGFVQLVETLDPADHGGSAGFRVLQHHLALAGSPGPGADPATGTGKPRTILEETLTVRLTTEPDANLVDYVTTQTNVTEQILELPAYRYGGGIAFRSPATWERDNSDYLTSEGRTRIDGHATRGRWCAMWGPTATGTATVVVMTHPTNHDFPNRMRLWPDGRIFFNFCPVQETGWELSPGDSATLRFRLAVLDGSPDPDRIETLWKAFAAAPEAP